MDFGKLLLIGALGSSLLVSGCGGGGGGGDGGDLQGFLSSEDWLLENEFYADRYVFRATRTTTVDVDMDSPDFDPYLMVEDEFGNVLEDDDSGPGDSAHISFTVTEGREYEVRATSFDAFDTGDYDLVWSRGLRLEGELRSRGKDTEKLPGPKIRKKAG